MMTNSFFRGFLLLWLHTFSKIVQVTCIEGPAYINGHIGDDAFFMWNRTDEGKILSVSWGIRKGNVADPQFINVNVYDNRVKKNQDLEEAFRKRTEFIGDLHKGHAWFKLKNLTVTDTNEYIASISDNVTRVLPYYVRLEVKEKRAKPTEGSSRTTKTPTADYDQTAANNTETAAAVNTIASDPNNTVPSASDHTLTTTVVVSLVCLLLALFFSVFFIRIYLKKRKKSNQQGKENHKSQKEDSSSL